MTSRISFAFPFRTLKKSFLDWSSIDSKSAIFFWDGVDRMDGVGVGVDGGVVDVEEMIAELSEASTGTAIAWVSTCSL